MKFISDNLTKQIKEQSDQARETDLENKKLISLLEDTRADFEHKKSQLKTI